MDDSKLLHILNVAHRLFFTLGLRSVTMEQLAQEAGVSKKTLYVYFKDKADLVQQVFSFFSQEHYQDLQGALLKEPNAIDQWIAIKEMVIRNYAEIQPSFYHDLEKYFPQTFKQFQDFQFVQLKNLIANNLILGVQQALYRHDLKPDIISVFYVNAIPLLFDARFFPRTQIPFIEVYNAFFTYHLYGITTPKGRAYMELKLQPSFGT
jgi:AcrR family transcriptional regulator